MKRAFIVAIVYGLLATVVGTRYEAAAQNKVPGNPMPQSASSGEAQSPAQKYFTDVELVNQNGEKLRLYSDLLKGKVVVITSFLATCTAACPAKNRNLERIQDAFGARLGKDLLILSITVDPVTDTPERLREYARSYHARRGWHFLSGKKENVDWALYKFGQYVENKDDHLNIMVVGNEASGLWKKAFALANSGELIKVIESVLNDKGDGSR